MEPSNRRRRAPRGDSSAAAGRSPARPWLGSTARPTSTLGLHLPRATLDARIDARYDAQLAAGFLDEVRALAGETLSRTARQALGYKELLDHIAGRCSFDDAMELARQRTRRFTRRQERWFRRDPRIRWIDASDKPESVSASVLEELER
jgi:tRNA dimethylallyltransferase